MFPDSKKLQVTGRPQEPKKKTRNNNNWNRKANISNLTKWNNSSHFCSKYSALNSNLTTLTSNLAIKPLLFRNATRSTHNRPIPTPKSYQITSNWATKTIIPVSSNHHQPFPQQKPRLSTQIHPPKSNQAIKNQKKKKTHILQDRSIKPQFQAHDSSPPPLTNHSTSSAAPQQSLQKQAPKKYGNRKTYHKNTCIWHFSAVAEKTLRERTRKRNPRRNPIPISINHEKRGRNLPEAEDPFLDLRSETSPTMPAYALQSFSTETEK